LQHTDIGNVKGDRDQRVLGHRRPSLRSQANHAAIVHHARPMRKPYI
jgi:hypothetical protein